MQVKYITHACATHVSGYLAKHHVHADGHNGATCWQRPICDVSQMGEMSEAVWQVHIPKLQCTNHILQTLWQPLTYEPISTEYPQTYSGGVPT